MSAEQREHPLVRACFSAFRQSRDGTLSLDAAATAMIEEGLAGLEPAELARVSTALAAIVHLLRSEFASPAAASMLLGVVDRATRRLESVVVKPRRASVLGVPNAVPPPETHDHGPSTRAGPFLQSALDALVTTEKP